MENFDLKGGIEEVESINRSSEIINGENIEI
jgi:hypothetical protein